MWLTRDDFLWYTWKDRMSAGTKRFAKGMIATMLSAGIQYVINVLTSNPQTILPEQYVIFSGALISFLLALEKMLQKAKM